MSDGIVASENFAWSENEHPNSFMQKTLEWQTFSRQRLLAPGRMVRECWDLFLRRSVRDVSVGLWHAANDMT